VIQRQPTTRHRSNLVIVALNATLLLAFAFPLIPKSLGRHSSRILIYQLMNSGSARQERGSEIAFLDRLRSLTTTSPRFIERKESLEGIEEDTDGRSDWFTFQRSYPSNELPSDARARAWKALKDNEASRFHTMANQTWHPIGPSPTISAWFPFWGLTSGRVNTVAVSSADTNIVLIGSSTGGIWRSTDRGETFLPVSDNQVDLAVGSIAFSKSNPRVAYAGMGDTKSGYLGSGVLKSTDAGQSWTRISGDSLPSPSTTAKLVIDPTNPDRVWVAQYTTITGNQTGSSGVFLSTDGGSRWQRVFAGAARDVVIDPADSRVIYAGMSQIDRNIDPPMGLYRSTDSGNTWNNLFTASQYDLMRRRDFRVAVSPTDSHILYAYYGGFVGTIQDPRLRVSTDTGATWADRSLLSVDTANLGYNTFLVVDPRDSQTLYLGSRDLYKSTDAGLSWMNVTRNFYDSGAGFQYAPGGSATHADQHTLTFSPSDQNEFYLGNDGGVSKTTDNGATFRSLNSSLTLTQFIGLSLHPTDSTISYGGTQDNGTQQRSSASIWQEVLSGDGGHSVINPRDPATVFMTYIRGDIFRFGNNGQTFELQVASSATFGENFDPPRIAFYPPFVSNGADSTLYFGSWRLFISNDLGLSWSSPSGFLDLTKGVTAAGADVLSTIAVSRSNANVIYTGSAQGRAMVSTNGGRSWSNANSGLPNRSITNIAVDPTNSSVAYLTVSGFNTGHVFKTTNTGASWTDVSSGLPDIPANDLLIDPTSADIIYLGSDIGVFRSTTRGTDWRSFNRGMPPVVIHDFAANEAGVIQVATYGRGAFELGAAIIESPTISSVNIESPKRVTIIGTGFGSAPRVLINGEDRSDKIVDSSETSVTLKAKLKKIGLRAGENTAQVISAENGSSNVFTVTVNQ